MWEERYQWWIKQKETTGCLTTIAALSFSLAECRKYPSDFTLFYKEKEEEEKRAKGLLPPPSEVRSSNSPQSATLPPKTSAGGRKEGWQVQGRTTRKTQRTARG